MAAVNHCSYCWHLKRCGIHNKTDRLFGLIGMKEKLANAEVRNLASRDTDHSRSAYPGALLSLRLLNYVHDLDLRRFRIEFLAVLIK